MAIRVGDYLGAALDGPWDAVVSALSIHHLQDEEKRRLYGRVFQALAPGGIFVNADNVRDEDPAVQARDRAAWIAAIRASGLPEAELEAALVRTQVDVLAPLELQLGWLRGHGFAEVGCAYKWRHFAVFSGRRAAGGAPPPPRRASSSGPPRRPLRGPGCARYQAPPSIARAHRPRPPRKCCSAGAARPSGLRAGGASWTHRVRVWAPHQTLDGGGGDRW